MALWRVLSHRIFFRKCYLSSSSFILLLISYFPFYIIANTKLSIRFKCFSETMMHSNPCLPTPQLLLLQVRCPTRMQKCGLLRLQCFSTFVYLEKPNFRLYESSQLQHFSLCYSSFLLVRMMLMMRRRVSQVSGGKLLVSLATLISFFMSKQAMDKKKVHIYELHSFLSMTNCLQNFAIFYYHVIYS